MKTKLMGLGILAAVIVAAVVYVWVSDSREVTEISGYVGGEKIGLLEDEEVQEILRDQYRLEMDYAKAGSIEMVTADASGRDYLFPSSQTALELYERLFGSPVKSEIVFNTPIVLYTRSAVAQALLDSGIASEQDGIYYVDMALLTEAVENGTSWADLGLPQLYGNVTVGTTDPVKSNSGNMFAALVANVLNGGQTLTEADLDTILPELQDIFGKLGYMETSSSDLFSQFLRMGVGAEPLIAGYESQLIEYAALYPDEYDRIRDDVVMLYPTPTVWSAHVMIALDENGQILLDAMQDEEVQDLAWKKHGFRTGNYGDIADSESIPADGVAASITQVAQVPSYDVMKVLIDQLE